MAGGGTGAWCCWWRLVCWMCMVSKWDCQSYMQKDYIERRWMVMCWAREEILWLELVLLS